MLTWFRTLSTPVRDVRLDGAAPRALGVCVLWALGTGPLLSACLSAQEAEPTGEPGPQLHEPQPPSGVSDAVLGMEEPDAVDLDVPAQPPQSALDLLGGQTGSESHDESVSPCACDEAGVCDEAQAQWSSDASTPLGFTAAQVAEQIAGSWQLQRAGEAPEPAALTLTQLGQAEVQPVLLAGECWLYLQFRAQAALALNTDRVSEFQLFVRADSPETFVALASLDSGTLGIASEADEILQLVLTRDDRVTSGWLQATQAADAQERRTLAVLRRD